MNDGGRERTKSKESDPPRKPGTDSFSRAIVRVGVGQICESEGFQGFQRSALEALSDIAIRYMMDIGKTAVSAANFAGRAEPNAFDIIHGVEDLRSVVGFSGGSDIDRCLIKSGAVREILNYVYDSEEIPFACPLPPFPVSKDRRQGPSFSQSGEEPPHKHIPPWLPKFPDCQTLEEKPELIKSEKSPSDLHHGIICNGSGLVTEPKEEKDGGINPFLAEPICSEVKEVSLVVLPPKVTPQFMNEVAGNHIEGKQACSDKSDEPDTVPKKVLLKQRPVVQFKIKSSRKILGSTLDLVFCAEEGVPERDCSVMHDNSINGENERAGKAENRSPVENTKDASPL